MADNNKITLPLYEDSRFDENKNKIILQSPIKYIKKLKVSLGLFSNIFYLLLNTVINIFSDLS